MVRHFLQCVILLLAVSMPTAGWSQGPPAVVRVTVVGGTAGMVLLFDSGGSLNSFSVITDAEGGASIPHLNCEICMVTVLDPRELFFNKTTEFDGRSASVTINLEPQPIIDSVGDPQAKHLRIKVYGPNGEPLRNQSVIVRPVVMTFEANLAIWGTTDSVGVVNAQLRPGKYIVAALSGENPLEGTIEIKGSRKELLPVHLAVPRLHPFGIKADLDR